MRYPLPRDTVTALQTHIRQCHNVGLRYDKFLTVEDASWELTRDESKKRSAAASMMNQADMRQLISRCRQRQQAILQSYKANSYEVSELLAAPDYRLVVGFGTEHVLETNLCLHRIHGFPVIPGSAVKGVARAWAFWTIAEQFGVPGVDVVEAERRKQAREKTPLQWLDQLLAEGTQEGREKMLTRLKADALCANVTALQSLDVQQWQSLGCDFYEVFGTTDKRGQVIFFDAYPTQAPKLEQDILNPHYGPYYSDADKRTPPADYHKLNPTYFLTVAKDTEFQFAVASKDPTLAANAKEWLSCALKELGIGGKTAAGYGFME